MMETHKENYCEEMIVEHQDINRKRLREKDIYEQKHRAPKKSVISSPSSVQHDRMAHARAPSEQNQNSNLPNFFKENNLGPYGVWIRKFKFDNNDLNAYKVGSIIFKSYKHIIDIKTRGKFKVEVLFKKREEANKILNDKNLKNHNLEAFIPGFRKVRKGIVKRMPIELSEDDILQSCQSEIEVLEVKRLMMRNRNITSEKDNKWIPSQSVMITFAGQSLPSEISVYYVKSKIEPYVAKPMQCFNCFRFGHTSKSCKSKTLCIMCGEEKHDEACSTSVPRCANCKENHKSINSVCPVYKKYSRINILMAYDNISFNEAKQIIMGPRGPPARSKENYPALGQPKITKFINLSMPKAHKVNNKNQNLLECPQLETSSPIQAQLTQPKTSKQVTSQISETANSSIQTANQDHINSYYNNDEDQETQDLFNEEKKNPSSPIDSDLKITTKLGKNNTFLTEVTDKLSSRILGNPKYLKTYDNLPKNTNSNKKNSIDSK